MSMMMRRVHKRRAGGGFDANTLFFASYDSDLNSLVGTFNGTAYGGAAVQGTTVKVGEGALGLAAASSQYVEYAANAVLGFGAAEKTIDFWVRPYTNAAAATRIIMGSGNLSSTVGWHCATYNRAFSWRVGNTTIAAVWGTLFTEAWHHVALVRWNDAGTLRYKCFLDGTNGYQNSTQVTSGSDPAFRVGNGNALEASRYFDGAIDCLRISDVARWTADFTPPTVYS